MKAKVKDKVIDPLTDFLDDEVLGGVVLLLLAAIAALIWANSPWSDSYFSFWSSYVSVGFGSLEINLDLQHWINDLFMAVFFFIVEVEIKRELVSGELKERKDAMVPVVAAIGGVALPAILFTLIAGGGAGAETVASGDPGCDGHRFRGGDPCFARRSRFDRGQGVSAYDRDRR